MDKNQSNLLTEIENLIKEYNEYAKLNNDFSRVAFIFTDQNENVKYHKKRDLEWFPEFEYGYGHYVNNIGAEDWFLSRFCYG